MRRLICSLLAALALLVLTPGIAWAQVHQHESESGVAMVRSLESLRDLDYDSWQAVAYREGKPGEPVVLRIVGYPGKLRIDHPVGLQVLAGRRTWVLDDITLDNPVLAGDGRDAAVEFALDPLLNDLTNNRPLRIVLPGVITELPVPPYVRWLPLPMYTPARIPSWELLFSISMGVWWGKGFTRGLVSPTLGWVPWPKPVIERKAELLLSPSNPAVTTASPPPVPMQF